MSAGDWRDQLDPELEPLVQHLPVVDLDDPLPFRAASDRGGAERALLVETGEVAVVDREVSHAGATARVRLYRPPGAPSVPAGRAAVLHLHGGGFVSGSSDSSHARNVELARDLDAVVVSVDYRRSPESPYPEPLDDAETALRWLVAGAAELDVDPARIALHGVSAGGALAAGLALRVRDGVPLRLLFLCAPLLDDRQGSASMARFDDTPIWSRRIGAAAWRHYLGSLAEEAATVPIEAAPGRARAEELRGLPPTYIAVTGLDPLCDEGLAFAVLLGQAEVPVEAHLFPGVFHAGVTMAPDTEVARRYRTEEEAVLARALAPRA
jgi:acetyl esterase